MAAEPSLAARDDSTASARPRDPELDPSADPYAGRSQVSVEVVIPLIVGCALFMQTLDSTVISTALPAIALSMHEDPITLNLAITAYLLSLAVFIPISGWMADRFGARKVFRTAIVVFTIGSVLCGASSTLRELVAARIIQGCGGAMMTPVGRLVLLRTVPKSGLVQAMSYLTIPAVLGPVVGPPVGGFIVTYFSWRWIFLMNVPFGVLGVFLVTLFIEDIRSLETQPLDLLGFLLTGFGLAGVVFGFEAMGRGVLPVALVMGLLIGAGLSLGLYVLHARRTTSAIIDLALLKIHTFRVATVEAGGLFRVGIGALPFLLAMLLQIGFGLTPFASGLITFTSAAGALLMKFTIGPIVRTWGFRLVLIVNGVISALFGISYALFAPTTSHAVIIATLLSAGFFRSLQFTSLNTLAYADIEQSMMSGANTVASMAQQLGLSLGVGIAAMILHITVNLRGERMLTANDFWPAFVITGLIAMLSVPFYFSLEHHAGAELSGHRPGVELEEEIEAATAVD